MKEIEITIKYQINKETYNLLEKYGYNWKKNAEEKAKDHAYTTAAVIKFCNSNKDKI